jgi:asparagine synthetase B (glutamine-hydrolysing)
MATGKNSTVAVGLSGGVDSSVAAFLLQRQGYNVIGLTMQIWDGTLPLPDEGRSGCYGPGEARDIEAAQRLAQRLGTTSFPSPVSTPPRFWTISGANTGPVARPTPACAATAA